MKTLNWKTLVLLATVASAVVLGGAFVFQALGYAPCKMCIWQRYPHGVAIAVGALALLTARKGLAWIGALAAATTSGIGFYHSGVERKLWAGPSSCTGASTEGLTPAELMDQIMGAPLIRCDEIPWELFGVTMANLNAVGSLVIAVVWVMAAKR